MIFLCIYGCKIWCLKFLMHLFRWYHHINYQLNLVLELTDIFTELLVAKLCSSYFHWPSYVILPKWRVVALKIWNCTSAWLDCWVENLKSWYICSYFYNMQIGNDISQFAGPLILNYLLEVSYSYWIVTD